jgi:hypothetical protein
MVHGTGIIFHNKIPIMKEIWVLFSSLVRNKQMAGASCTEEFCWEQNFCAASKTGIYEA